MVYNSQQHRTEFVVRVQLFLDNDKDSLCEAVRGQIFLA